MVQKNKVYKKRLKCHCRTRYGNLKKDYRGKPDNDIEKKGLSKKKWAALIILNLQVNSNLLKFKYEQRRK